MPKPSHTRVTWSGIFGSIATPEEIWSFGLNLGDVAFADQAARDAAAVACKDAYLTHIAPVMKSYVRLTRARVAQIGPDGKVSVNASGSYNQADWLGDVPGSSSAGSVLPISAACCVSLMTPRAGATGRGRFYLPAPAVTLDGPGVFSSATQTDIATRAEAFIKAVDIAVDSVNGGNVSVVSSKGYATIVTGVRVGRVVDVQTRRREDMAEQYVTRAVAQ